MAYGTRKINSSIGNFTKYSIRKTLHLQNGYVVQHEGHYPCTIDKASILFLTGCLNKGKEGTCSNIKKISMFAPTLKHSLLSSLSSVPNQKNVSFQRELLSEDEHKGKS